MIFKKKKEKRPPFQTDDTAEADYTLDYSEASNNYESGRFLNSVEQLSEEDITSPTPVLRKKKITVYDVIRKGFVLLFSAVFLVSCAFLVQNILSKYRAREIYAQLKDEFFSAGFNFDIENMELIDDGEVSRLSSSKENNSLKTWTELMASGGIDPENREDKKEYNEELEKMRAGLTALSRINPDIYGWITVEGTQIDYPLVQGEDNDFYLDHAYTGVPLPEGSIFVDYRNSPSVADNYNTVFYGHNLTSGGMFHDVTKFAKDEYMADKLIYVYTFDGVFIYEPFSFYEARYDYNYFRTNFNNANVFISFAEEVQLNTAATNKKLDFTGDDRLLTLSTCTNGYYTQRYALHARLIQSITE